MLIMLLDSSMVEHSAVNRVVVGSSPTRGANFIGAHSSAVEQSAHNRSVPGSNPGGPTIIFLKTKVEAPLFSVFKEMVCD